jgi:hypothetical protein
VTVPIGWARARFREARRTSCGIFKSGCRMGCSCRT